MFNVHLKHYYHETPKDRKETNLLIYSNIGDFHQVPSGESPQFGDLIIFKIHGIESHIGVLIDESRFIHSSKTTGSVIDRIEKWKHLIVGYYRHGKPAND